MNCLFLRRSYPDAMIYGVVWDYNSTDAALKRLTQGNDPNGYVNTNITTEPAPGRSSSPFDSLMPWAGMEEYNIISNAVGPKKGESGFSRTDNDTVVFIPEYYCKIIDDATNKKRYFYIADAAQIGFTKHPGSGKYVGKYMTSAGTVSKSGYSPVSNVSLQSHRANAIAKGSKWSLYDYASWCAVWLLYLVEFANWNSQEKIGDGRVNESTVARNGETDSLTYHTGSSSPGTAYDDKSPIQYRHIENLWGNGSEFVDGINFYNRRAYICTDRSKYASNTTTGYTDSGVTVGEYEGYIKALGYSASVGWAFLPIYPTETSSVGEFTNVCDYFYSNNNWRSLETSGGLSDKNKAGLFYFSARGSGAASYSTYSRLLFNP